MNGNGEMLLRVVFLLLVGAYVAGDRPRQGEWMRLLALIHLGAAALLGFLTTSELFLTGEVNLNGFGQVLLMLLPIWWVKNRIAWIRERKRTTHSSTPSVGQRWQPFSLWEWLLVVAILLGLGTAVARVVLLPLDWDGWAIWQLKAQGIVQGDLQRQLTSVDYHFSHPDYPLLVPTHTAWLTGSTFDPKVAQWGGLLFLLDLLVLFYVEARRLAGRPLALAGCMVLLSWALTMKHTASGFADIPMSAYAFASITALLRGELWTLALALVGAVLTKNEGLFTLGGVLVALPFAARSWPGASSTSRLAWLRGLVALLPAVLALLAWGVMKRRWGLFSDMLNPAQWARDPLALLPGRAWTVLRGYIAQALAVGPRYPGWGLLWPAVVWSLVDTIRQRRGWTLPLWLLVGAHFGGAALAYLVTATDAGLHLSRSLDRLWLHVAPVALLAMLISQSGTKVQSTESE